jgi:hypothetical protein
MLIAEMKPPRAGETVSETTHKPEVLFAIDEDPSHPDLSRSLADYRRLNASQRAAYAAELKRTVEIAEQRRPSRRRQKGFVALLVGSLFGRSLVQAD